MANEVSFFHAARKFSIERDIAKTERIVKLIERTKDSWAEEGPDEEVANICLLDAMKEDLDKMKKALARCDEDLAQALAERK